jgi:ribosomal protein S18 acetylase RimI-like enzyme
MAGIRIVDVVDALTFDLVPPCADPRFDHRTCDYWEDAERGSKASRPGWLTSARPVRDERPRPAPDNPFMPGPAQDEAGWLAAALAADDEPGESDWNPFASAPRRPAPASQGGPRKISLLVRGMTIFGSYAKVLMEGDEPAGWVQFGPLSAYPRAMHIRELYPRLPQAPLPAVITCIATTSEARSRGLARRLVEEVCLDLAGRGFAAVEAYPDRTLGPDESSAPDPGFWKTCGFSLAIDDERFPVVRRELG